MDRVLVKNVPLGNILNIPVSLPKMEKPFFRVLKFVMVEWYFSVNLLHVMECTGNTHTRPYRWGFLRRRHLTTLKMSAHKLTVVSSQAPVVCP